MVAVKLDLLFQNILDIKCTDAAGQLLAVPPLLPITGITTDPNLCRPGFLYVAEECETVDSKRYGVRLDGRDYIDLAVQNGAVAILSTPDQLITADRKSAASTVMLSHPQPLSILGELSSRFFGQPRPEHIAVVTGTNGKTSTVNFCRMLWSMAHLPACSIGNLGGVCSDGSVVWDRDPTLSVPETVTLHKLLHDIAGRGFNHVAMEATSHALFDHRLNGVPASIGAFTNLTRDHLDFHQSMDEYFRVKMTLFDHVLPPGSWAVLNADADWYEPALTICQKRGHKIISFGFNGKEVRLVDCRTTASGQELWIEVFGKKYQCTLHFFGLFQTSNVLCSLAIVLAAGLSPEQAIVHINKLTEVEGRLNTVAFTPGGGRVIVDYAHSPDGIRAALEACRSFTSGKLTIVFGCNGERDAGKRHEMGEVASHLADRVIVTDGHPRSEDPALIRKGRAGRSALAPRK